MNNRVLFITASSNFGGTETLILNLIKGLRNLGVEVGIICPKSGLFSDEADQTYYLDVKNSNSVSVLSRVSAIVKEFRPALIHTHLARATYIGLYLSVFHKSTVVATVHNVLGNCEMRPSGKFGLSRNTNLVYKLLSSFGGRLVAVSEYISDALLADGIVAGNVVTITNGTGFADEEIEPSSDYLRSQISANPDDYLVGIIGGIRPGKGQLEAVKALTLLPETVLDKLRLVLIGKMDDSDYHKSIISLITEHKLTDKVLFAGVQTRMQAVYADLDVVLHPSYSEACCMAIIEAMSMGKAVVASNIAANAALIDHEQSGLLVPLEPEAISQALVALEQSPELADRLGAAARIKAVEAFSLKKMSENYLQFYRSIA